MGFCDICEQEKPDNQIKVFKHPYYTVSICMDCLREGEYMEDWKVEAIEEADEKNRLSRFATKRYEREKGLYYGVDE